MSSPSSTGDAPNGKAVPRAVAVVAGHICLDIIPEIRVAPGPPEKIIVPGALTSIGPAALSTGGAVSNTGLALHKLGISTRLMGKVGDDLFGRAIIDLVRSRDPELATGMIVSGDSPSSYTIVISAPGVDRSFLHCSGANDTFDAGDVDVGQLADVQLFHFGYPPLMQRVYRDGGRDFSGLLHRIKQTGVAVSLDMAHVDVDGPAGQIDWREFLMQVLPNVDFFLPSLDEILFMLDRPRFDALVAGAGSMNLAQSVDADVLADLADQAIALGAAVVGIKLGDQGIYLCTTSDPQRLASVGKLTLDTDAWLARELIAPAFQVRVVGTTGAGDCAIAGFFAAVLRGQTPAQAMMAATAAGAYNVEVADAVSGIPAWGTMQARLASGWSHVEHDLARPGWQRADGQVLWSSPRDRQRHHY